MAPPSTPDESPSKNMFDTIVDIEVGKGADRKTFKLHKGILCFYSAYFDRALNGGFEEARRGSIDLSTENVDTFERFVLWLYTRKVDVEGSTNPFAHLCRLWVFADCREIPLLMNACIDAIKDVVAAKWVVPTGNLSYIYANTTATSGLRRLVIHLIGHTLEWKDPDCSAWPKDSLRDLLNLRWNWDKSMSLSQDGVAKMDTCKFHFHEEGVTCSKKRKRDTN